MATCDTLEVDLSPPPPINITLEQYPCIDVQILSPDITIEAVTVANQGPKGDQGPIGPTGPTGPVGPSGPIGPTGAQGVQGPAGPKGDLGPQGATGPTGSQGVAGPQGAQGPIGSTGPQGSVGPQGPIGQGLTPKGTVANSGSLPASGNTTGDIWITSDTGHGWSWNGTQWIDMGPFQGPAGATGPQGATGATGATGPQGPKGADSTVPGPQGPPGATGSQGPQGATGTAGVAATIAVGTTTTGTPGTNAAVSNSGSSSAAVFNFTVPAGVQGAAGAQGSTGPQGPPGPTAVSTDSGNIATLGSDSKILVPQSQIWSVRLRSFNAVGTANPTFEVDQRLCGTSVTMVNNTPLVDRWWASKAGTMVATAQQTAGIVNVPGFNSAITNSFLRITITTAQASLGATDILGMFSSLEGIALRELISDAHSISLLVRTTAAGLKFGVVLQSITGTVYYLAKLCTVPNANTWTLIPLPNIPVWAAGGTWPVTPGNQGYNFRLTLACGTSYVVSANDVWQSSGTFLGGAVGQSNFAANSGATFDIAFVQHEPGPQCTTPIDCPFTQNYDACLRYYCKSYDYGVVAGTVSGNGMRTYNVASSNLTQGLGNTAFPKMMAKNPTFTFYNHSTGAANSAQDSAGINHAVTGALLGGASGYNGMLFSTACSAPMGINFHYLADTGW